jgi:hypothetical protein
MKKLIALSAVAAMAATGVMADQAADIKDLQKDIKRLKASLSEVKAQAGGDNIKWDVDFRTSVDMLTYKTADGQEYQNDALMANRLWLGMGYAPGANMIFKGQLAFNKAFGAAPTNPATGFPQRGYGYDSFDWVLNENLTDDTLRVREAYWLYKSDSLFGSDVSWTASVGRRPSTNGFLASLRDDDKPKSPLGHVINMEFDGASFKFGLDKVTGVDGMYWKLCLGRGLSNARARFNMDGGFYSYGDYTEDPNTLESVDMAGFIFVPYDDGQYSVQTTYYRGFNVPGFLGMDAMGTAGTGMIDGSTGTTFNPAVTMYNMGDMDGAAVSIMANGIGDGISDFLDDTVLFASFAASETQPDKELTDYAMMAMGAPTPEAGMLGSTENERGYSYWVGAQIPAMFTEDGRLGVEFNHGSKYWRPFTYGEDTMAGSKLATRGDAYEVYYTQPLMDGFSMQLRATQMEYDYTGSQMFFGFDGTPMTMAQAQGMGMTPVEEARDIRLYFRYRY